MAAGTGAPNENVQLVPCAPPESASASARQQWRVRALQLPVPQLDWQTPVVQLELAGRRGRCAAATRWHNVELADCDGSAAQQWQLRGGDGGGGTIASVRFAGAALTVDALAHGAAANVVVLHNASATAAVPAWVVGNGSTFRISAVLPGHPGTLQCVDVGSAGATSDGRNYTFRAAAAAAPTGAQQVYFNISAPSWGGSVIKESGQYHLFVLAMDAHSQYCANPNDPNAGGCFDLTGRIDRAVSASPLGPFLCVQQDVLGRRGGNPQVFRAGDGTLLLAAQPKDNICNVWRSDSGGARGPWSCHSNATNQGFNNPSLAAAERSDRLVLFYHAPKFWGSAVYGATAQNDPDGAWLKHAVSNSSRRMEYGHDQLFIHPCEDPFGWFDRKAQRFRMLTHTFRMGMICGAGTTQLCGGGVDLSTGCSAAGCEPLGGFASSAGPAPFDGWTYHEDSLAFDWQVPTTGGGSDAFRRRERPSLLFDDDGRVYLYTSVSPADGKRQMCTHGVEVLLPFGVGGPH
eukprot:SAG22_NODE_95_length_20791_cov_40.318514_13_plen_517_part_00